MSKKNFKPIRKIIFLLEISFTTAFTLIHSFNSFTETQQLQNQFYSLSHSQKNHKLIACSMRWMPTRFIYSLRWDLSRFIHKKKIYHINVCVCLLFSELDKRHNVFVLYIFIFFFVIFTTQTENTKIYF